MEERRTIEIRVLFLQSRKGITYELVVLLIELTLSKGLAAPDVPHELEFIITNDLIAEK